jgi:hypothetical protein
LEKEIDTAKQDDGRILELEVRLKVSEEEKGEYKKKIVGLQDEIRELKRKEWSGADESDDALSLV